MVQNWLKRRVRSGPAGPSAEERAASQSVVWGEVTDAAGNRVVARLHGPEGYTFTMLTALAIVERVLVGSASPGFQTPATAYGADLVLGIPGVRREDMASPA